MANGNTNHCKDCIYFRRGMDKQNSLFTCTWFDHHPEHDYPMWLSQELMPKYCPCCGTEIKPQRYKIFPNSSGCRVFTPVGDEAA